MKPCTCDNHRPGPYTADQCRLCWLYYNNATYRDLWDRGGSTMIVTPHKPYNLIPCPECPGRVFLKVPK